jgi:hypothetical protein
MNNSQKLVSESISSTDQLFTSKTHQKVRVISDELFSWTSAREFKGRDPFDALNSPLLKGVSSINRWAGQAALQLVKRSPINLRPALLVPKTTNAKALGLILMPLIIRYRLNRQDEDMQFAFQLARWLKEHQSKGYGGACWGYPFDWPNRAFYAPAGTPTIVNTAFIGGSLLDLFEETTQEEWLDLAVSACEFICRDLKRSAGKQGFCFSYTPIDQSRVHNANLLGAAICLCDLAARFHTPPDLAEKVLSRMIDLFWSGKGYFYRQKQHGFLYRLACMRWVQAWAFLALMKHLENRSRPV